MQARLKNLRRRVNAARKFPDNTCVESRHLQLIAEHMATGKAYPMLQEEPGHCAETMLSVLESLWKARTDLARLKTTNEVMQERSKLIGWKHSHGLTSDEAVRSPCECQQGTCESKADRRCRMTEEVKPGSGAQ